MWSASPEISRDTTGSLAERCGFPVGRGVYSRDMGRGNSREGGGAVSLSASAVDRDSNGSNGRALTSPRAPGSCPPHPLSRTNWTRPVLLPVLTGHVSSFCPY